MTLTIPRGRNHAQPWALAVVLLSLVAMMVATLFWATRTEASHTTGTYALYSPASLTKGITSPTRFHDGCSATYHYDSPDFDNGTCLAAISGGQWNMDFQGSDGNSVWLDFRPQAFEQYSAGARYRLVASTQGQWDPSANGRYQYFRADVWNSGTSSWETYAYIVFGHIDNFRYTSGTVIADTSSSTTVVVADVAPQGSWPEHLHVEVYNAVSGRISRAYDWDGPQNTTDTGWGPMCTRTGTEPNPATCNTEIRAYDAFAYVGGSWSTFVELNNPHYELF